jgi:hypothetical protein
MLWPVGFALAAYTIYMLAMVYISTRPEKPKPDRIRHRCALVCDDGRERWVIVSLDEGSSLDDYAYLIGHTEEGNILGEVRPNLVHPYLPEGEFKRIGETPYPEMTVEQKLDV